MVTNTHEVHSGFIPTKALSVTAHTKLLDVGYCDSAVQPRLVVRASGY